MFNRIIHDIIHLGIITIQYIVGTMTLMFFFVFYPAPACPIFPLRILISNMICMFKIVGLMGILHILTTKHREVITIEVEVRKLIIISQITNTLTKKFNHKNQKVQYNDKYYKNMGRESSQEAR